MCTTFTQGSILYWIVTKVGSWSQKIHYLSYSNAVCYSNFFGKSLELNAFSVSGDKTYKRKELMGNKFPTFFRINI